MSVIEEFKKKGITGLVEGVTQQKVKCPDCSKFRKKSDEPCLSCNIELGTFHCHNCGKSGGVAGGTKLTEHYTKKEYKIPNYEFAKWNLNDDTIKYFEGRGISAETLQQNKVGSNVGKMLTLDPAPIPIISFPYIKNKVVNVKYRGLKEKIFKMVSGAEICLYGIQNLFEDGQLATKKIFITEGEIDALSLYECGFRFALSVPSGASVEEQGSAKITPKLDYLDDPDIISVLSNVDEVVLVCDTDYKGQRLKDELAIRIGIAKCFYVSYPSDCKDINDVLVKHGKDAVIEAVLDYKPMLEGMVTVSSLGEDKLLDYYNHGSEGGMVCGIEGLDDIFTVQHSQLITITGTPESFKSVFVDNMTRGLAINYDIHSCLYSPESRPLEMHVSRLASMHNGYRLGLPDEDDRMPYEEFKASCKWVDKHYSFINPPNNTLEEIIQLWQISLTQKGTKVFVLDPYSKVNWEGENEHQFIRRMLNELGEFSARNRVTVMLVAHPRKMELQSGKGTNGQQDYKIVQPYDISGSSSFYNSSDIILSLWKSKLVHNPPLKVYVQKSKLHNIAKSGKSCELPYNPENWRLGEDAQYDIDIISDYV